MKHHDIKKIIFLVCFPFCQRDFERFNIQILLNNDFEVEVWDFTRFLNIKLKGNYSPPDPINWSGHKTFNDKESALRAIEALGCDTFVIVHILYIRTSYSFFRALSASKARYATSNVNALPPNPENKSGLRKITSNLDRPMKELWEKIINKCFIRCPCRLFRIRPANLFFAGGKETLNKYLGPIDSTTEVLWTHTMDYEVYLKEREKDVTERPIAVFLDGYVPFHPDFLSQGMSSPVTADKYYPMMNKFFKLVEEQLGLEVVIAAHPRSNYEEHPDYFEKRKWLKGQTLKLVRESRFVMTHGSAALTFANLFYKPVIFLTFAELDDTLLGAIIKTMSKWFGKKPIYLDDLSENGKTDWERELAVNTNLYDTYRHSFIKIRESLDLLQGEILVDRLRKGFAEKYSKKA